jgi:polyphosphate kinase
MTAVRPAPGPRAASRGRRRGARDNHNPILNRELSWVEFNARVLHEAADGRNPLLERVKFLSIFASNLDEFFQVRVSGLRRQHQAGGAHHSADGLSAGQQLDAIRVRVRELVDQHSAIWSEIRAELATEGVEIVDYDDVPEHHQTLRRRFHDEIFPVLTPLAVDPGHPFPYISTLSLSIAVGLMDPETGSSSWTRSSRPTSTSCSRA